MSWGARQTASINPPTMPRIFATSSSELDIPSSHIVVLTISAATSAATSAAIFKEGGWAKVFDARKCTGLCLGAWVPGCLGAWFAWFARLCLSYMSHPSR
eukprot:200867-Rhodomonas_salina.3